MAKKQIKNLEGTERIEAFSDGIFAFSMTLLVMNINIPPFTDESSAMVTSLLIQQLPIFITFIFSFLVIAILWVNHHHFFHNCPKSDWKLLWFNNFLLFWTILIPFTTNLIGSHPYMPVAVATYSGDMFMVAVSFFLMVRYVFFKSSLIESTISKTERKKEFRKTFPALFLYGMATILAFYATTIALIILVIVPIFYFVPSVLNMDENF